jgi:hypothetical protein
MSFANLLSSADLASRRSEAARLLQVAIDNEVYLEEKMKKFQDPRKIDEVPPVYQTYSELIANSIQQEQLAIKNLAELKIPYDMGAQIAQFLNQTKGQLVLFNASFPTIKADIMKRYNVKLLDITFLKNYLLRFFAHLDTSYGFSIDKDAGSGRSAFNSVAEAKAIIPTTDGLKAGDAGVLTTLYELILSTIRIYGGGSTLPELVGKLMMALPTQAELNTLNDQNQIIKKQLLQNLSKAFTNLKCPTSAEVIRMIETLKKATLTGQFLVGRDEQSEVGRETTSVAAAAMISQLEILFRGCSDQNLAFMTGVRRQIQKGEAMALAEDFGEQLGQENIRLQVQEMASQLLQDGNALNQVRGFDEAENAIIREREYEEEIADDVPDDVMRAYNQLIRNYYKAVSRYAGGVAENISYLMTQQGFNYLLSTLNTGFNLYGDEEEGEEFVEYPYYLRLATNQLNTLINTSGRSFAELLQLSGGRSEEQQELQAAERQFYLDNAVADERGNKGSEASQALGRALLYGDDVGGMPQAAGGGGGGAARPSRRQEEQLPEGVVEGYDRERTPLILQERWDITYPEYSNQKDFPQPAMIDFSRSFGGVRQGGLSGTEVYLPLKMTPNLILRMRKFVDDYKEEQRAMEEEAKRPKRSAEEERALDESIAKSKVEASQRMEEQAIRERQVGMRDFLKGRLAQFKKGDKEVVAQLFDKVMDERDKAGLGRLKIRKDSTMEEIKEKIISSIIALHEQGVRTILSEGNPQTFGQSNVQSGSRNFGVGMKRRIGGRISQLPPMNPYDKKKFLETAEGREFMNLHPREKILDRKFIEQHEDEDEGMGLYRMTRIPVRKGKVVKKKIGGGIAVQATPTYAEFGKYAVHLPQLHNKNTLNIKYKSLGAIPTLKPITISDDFKDFIIETLEKKSVNERALKKLPAHEISYFERAVSGAGLLETFKMKRTNTDEEKKDLDRFTLLRGELIAGNNSDKLVKELRSLIVKFLNTGRIHKAEGMNLLQELSVL